MEYVLWALPKGQTDKLYEKVITCTPDKDKLAKARTWAKGQGFHSFHIQNLGGSLPDFTKTLNN